VAGEIEIEIGRTSDKRKGADCSAPIPIPIPIPIPDPRSMVFPIILIDSPIACLDAILLALARAFCPIKRVPKGLLAFDALARRHDIG
jgi:hypothetical protein